MGVGHACREPPSVLMSLLPGPPPPPLSPPHSTPPASLGASLSPSPSPRPLLPPLVQPTCSASGPAGWVAGSDGQPVRFVSCPYMCMGQRCGYRTWGLPRGVWAFMTWWCAAAAPERCRSLWAVWCLRLEEARRCTQGGTGQVHRPPRPVQARRHPSRPLRGLQRAVTSGSPLAFMPPVAVVQLVVLAVAVVQLVVLAVAVVQVVVLAVVHLGLPRVRACPWMG